MASRLDDRGQLLLLAGILLVLAYMSYSMQTSIVATLGQEAGRDAGHPTTSDYVLLRENIQLTLELEQGGTCLPVGTDTVPYVKRARTILENMANVQTARGFLFQGTVTAVRFLASASEYDAKLYFSDGETTVSETLTFKIAC